MIRKSFVAMSFTLLLGCGDSRDPTTASHAIWLDSLVSLGYNAGPYSPTMKSEVVWIPGLYVLSNTHARGEMAILNEQGQFLRSLGAQGDGPGEFQQIDAVGADTARHRIHVLDSQNGRITALDTAGRVHSETAIRLFANQVDVLSTSEYVAHPLRDRSTPGLPATVLSPDTVSEVGYDDPVFRNNARVTVGPDGGIWISRYDRYEINKYARDGTLLKSVRRSPVWFRAFDPVRLARRGGRATVIADIAVDSEERLWVLITEANVTPEMLAQGRGASGGGERRSDPPSVAKLYTHSRIEIVDARSGVLLASYDAREHLFRGFVDAGRLYALYDDSTGVIGAQVWRARLMDHPNEEIR